MERYPLKGTDRYSSMVVFRAHKKGIRFSELTSVDADINSKCEKWKLHCVHNVNAQFAQS